MDLITKNWKTSLAGTIIIALGALNTFLGIRIPGFNLDFTAALAAGAGLILAKDAGVSDARVIDLAVAKKAAMLFLAFAIAWALMAPGLTRAQNYERAGATAVRGVRAPLTGNIINDVGTAIKGAEAKAQSDLTSVFQQLESMLDTGDAVALATQIPGVQDTVGAACWKSFANLSAVLAAHPVPLTLKLAVDIEAMRLATIALNQVCTNPNCGQMWTDASNVATALAVGGIPISFASICSKVPAIGSNAAAAVTAVQPAASALGNATTLPAVPGASTTAKP